VYYDLEAGRAELGAEGVAIVRVEQFYPFNTKLFEEVVAPYRDAAEVLWVQEETRNRGGWSYMMPILQEHFPQAELRYVGRGPSASPATGSPGIHREEQAALVREALVVGSA
jgi:2-oxoglutarate dehydrogenase complex dehydrogenase (E1) component-like enzyme